MSCCGSKRQRLREPNPGGVEAGARTFAPRGRDAPPAAATAAGFSVVLEYSGPTALTAIGPTTGHRYRFPAHGARVAVAPADVAGLLTVPTLHRAV